MITKQKLDEKEPIIREAIEEVFDRAKRNQFINNDYIVFLANGSFEQRLVGNVQKLSPYVIDSQEDKYKDLDRIIFYVDYLNSNPALILDRLPEESKDRHVKFYTSMEMMIYAHLWESTQYLKILHNLATLIDRQKYNWKSPVNQHTNRQQFIRSQREVFNRYGLKIADLITQSYHSQIRNAFAHSDYSYGMGSFESDILLWNYEEKHSSRHLKGLSLEEWNERFAISVSLTHYIFEKINLERRNLGANRFTIMHPNYYQGDRLKPVDIEYSPERDYFRFV
ncbi:hypothetical protein GCM10023187_47610 [Nibrella viscosa]|uniref:Uncharacterized protein n=1 Tax=Nibrella viscosa TaxID=1084524 RepID=A0ABP8KV20_9BACT